MGKTPARAGATRTRSARTHLRKVSCKISAETAVLNGEKSVRPIFGAGFHFPASQISFPPLEFSIAGPKFASRARGMLSTPLPMLTIASILLFNRGFLVPRKSTKSSKTHSNSLRGFVFTAVTTFNCRY